VDAGLDASREAPDIGETLGGPGFFPDAVLGMDTDGDEVE